MAEKDITLKHVGYQCKGTALINLWGGGQSRVNMDSWSPKKIDRQNIAKGVNDGQFGCESIESAEVDVYDIYGRDIEQFKMRLNFSQEELKNAKRGI